MLEKASKEKKSLYKENVSWLFYAVIKVSVVQRMAFLYILMHTVHHYF